MPNNDTRDNIFRAPRGAGRQRRGAAVSSELPPSPLYTPVGNWL